VSGVQVQAGAYARTGVQVQANKGADTPSSKRRNSLTYCWRNSVVCTDLVLHKREKPGVVRAVQMVYPAAFSTHGLSLVLFSGMSGRNWMLKTESRKLLNKVQSGDVLPLSQVNRQCCSTSTPLPSSMASASAERRVGHRISIPHPAAPDDRADPQRPKSEEPLGKLLEEPLDLSHFSAKSAAPLEYTVAYPAVVQCTAYLCASATVFAHLVMLSPA
jgi:hypothetical protein